jgi:DNA-binding response OmpR family regulator
MRVLLVEDDHALIVGVRHALQAEGWRVDVLSCGEQAVHAGLNGEHDVAVLDLGLPRRDGMDVLRHWRSRGARFPVLMLTARDQLADRVAGLDAGADDYLVKPFDLPELLARLRALGRRAAGRAENMLLLGELVLHVNDRELRHRGERVALSPRAW